jgi:DNA uptake protein ComE-like DNA-binding protein
MRDAMKARKEKGRGYLTGIIAVVFMIIGYQTALFVHHAAVMKLTANRDEPDTVYIYQYPAKLSKSSMGTGTSVSAVPSQVSGEVIRKNAAHSQRAEAVRSNAPRKNVETFRFNPNTATEEDLCRLGFTPKQAASIVAYRVKGGKYRRKADFAASFVVSDSIFKRLEPYIDIPLIDLNLADSAAFDSLPGIGGWFASKMVSYRKELGGYSYKEQLMEIWKFDQEKYDALADLITLNPENLRQYPLWTLPADSLRKHPYIRNYETARAIVLFRDNNPPENYTIQALEQSGIISSETASRLSRCAISPTKTKCQ